MAGLMFRTIAVLAASTGLMLAATATAQSLPAPPVALTAAVIADTVTLSWLTSHGSPATYVVEAGTGPGLADIATVAIGATATSFAATAVPDGNYHLRVRAATPFGMSAASNEVIVRVGGACPLPDAPSGLNAVVVAGQLTLQWNGTGGTFRLEVGSAAGRSDLFAGDIGGATTFTAGVPAGFYVVRVREQNACGLGPASSEVVARAGVPDAPETLAGSVIANVVTLRWTPPPGTTVDGYVLSAGSAPGQSDIATLPLGNQLLLSVPGVAAGTYFVRLQALAGGLVGPPTREVAVTVGAAPPGTSVVTFNSLPLNGPAFVTHTEAAMTVEAVSGPWTSGPALLSRNTTSQTPLDSEVRVTAAAGTPFRLVSARLYSSVTPIPCVYRGVRGGTTLYTFSATVPNTFGNFATVPNPFTDVVVDEVYITVTNPAIPTCPSCTGNPVGLDDVVVRVR